MNSIIFYPNELEKFIKEGNIYIPRKLKFEEHLKLYRRYWINDDQFIKVDQIFTVGDIEYYNIKYLNYRFGTISYPIDFDSTYELMIDKNNISTLEDIINNGISYTGAEIRFWFFIHNIDLKSNKYFGFGSFINMNSRNLISDNKSYFIRASVDENGNYYDCKVSLDKEKETIRKRRERRNNV